MKALLPALLRACSDCAVNEVGGETEGIPEDTEVELVAQAGIAVESIS